MVLKNLKAFRTFEKKSTCLVPREDVRLEGHLGGAKTESRKGDEKDTMSSDFSAIGNIAEKPRKDILDNKPDLLTHERPRTYRKTSAC